MVTIPRVVITTIGIVSTMWATNAAYAQTSDDSIREIFEKAAQTTPIGAEQVSAIMALAALEVTTAPSGSSTGGFTFAFDPQTGGFSRSSRTFGPAFAERSTTAGKGKLSAGFNWVHSTYDSVAGQDLSQGVVLFRTLPPVAPVSTITMNMSSDAVVGFATFGATDNLDVGVSVPWVRFNIDDVGSTVFGQQQAFAPAISRAGLGDLGFFAKYRFWERGGSGFAGYLDVQVPTGDADNLRGLGVTRTLISAVWSRAGRIAPHVNVGYEFWSDHVVVSPALGVNAKNQFKYAVGTEFMATPRATVLLTLVGRRLLGGGRLDYESVPQAPGIEALLAQPQGLDVASLAPGIKWNAYRSLLVNVQVLASLKNEGLRANVTPVVGIDWTF